MITWLPALITLPEFGGDWGAYLDAVYGAFRADFVGNPVSVDGCPVVLKKHPLSLGKEATFWHLVSEGAIEEARTPDLRRCERIRWPRAIIENCSDSAVRVWRNSRKGDQRMLLYLEKEDYLVVLSHRNTYAILWTAFLADKGHTRRRLLQEYDQYQKKLGSPPS